MASDASLEYAITRVHARHARLLDEATWRRVESSRDPAHFLGSLRTTTLAEWVAAIDDAHDSHSVERVLRARWSSYVYAVASWHPLAWQPWLRWLAWLPGLSLLAHITRGGTAPAWLLADPVYSTLALGSAAERTAALEHTALAPLAPQTGKGVAVLTAWQVHWQALLPKTDEHARQLLNRLERIVARHAAAMRQPTDAGDSGNTLRLQLSQSLAKLFRRAAGTVVATICHLALLALQLERLRGGLIRRKLFATSVQESA